MGTAFLRAIMVSAVLVSSSAFAQSGGGVGPPCKVLSELDGFSVVVSIFGLDDCWEYSGTLNLQEDVVLHTQGGEVSVPAGPRAATLKQQTHRTIVLAAELEADKRDLPFKVPKDFELPTSGDVYLPSEESGQPVDVAGHIEFEESQTEEFSAIESCSYSLVEYVSIDGSYECHTTNYNDGEMRVRYYFDVTETLFRLELFDPATLRYLGDFTSALVDLQRIYTFQSTCFQRRQDDWRC
jgi:hypothetical protein